MLGLAKLSKGKKAELEGRGLIACEEGLSLVVALRNYRDPWGRMCKLKKTWTVGNIVVTKEDVSVFTGDKQIFRHEWNVPAAITCTVGKSGRLKFTVDLSAVPGDPRSGTLTTALTTVNALRYKAHFDAHNKPFSASGGGIAGVPGGDSVEDEEEDHGGIDYNYNCYE